MSPTCCRRSWLHAIAAAIFAVPLLAQEPRQLGFEDGGPGALPEPWFVRSAEHWQAGLTDAHATAGARSLHLRRRADAPGADPNGFGNVMMTMPAEQWRGRHVAMRARLRVQGSGQAQMWLRVDLPGGGMGGFDNMGDRPARDGDWRPVSIELDVDDQAERLAFGFMIVGDAELWIDDATLLATGAAAPRQPATSAPLGAREQDNLVAATRLLGHLRFFHPDPAAVDQKEWDRFAIALMAAAGPANDAADLATRLGQVIAPLAPTAQVWAGTPADAPALPPPPADATRLWSWRHNGAGRVAQPESIYTSTIEKSRLLVPLTPEQHAHNQVQLELGGGVSVRYALRVPVNDAGKPAPIDAAWNQPGGPRIDARNRDTRLAAIASTWTTLEHFYPYFDVVDVDWAAALPRALADAADDAGAEEFLDTLQRLVAQLRDGHGFVGGPAIRGRTLLPVAVAWASGELVIVGSTSEAAAQVRVGEVITAIDGVAVDDHLRQMAPLIPAATEGHRRHLSESKFQQDLRTGDPVRLQVRDTAGSLRTVTLPRAREVARDARPAGPDNGSELAPGIVWFRLDSASDADLEAALPALTAAKGVVIDLRGYPGTAGTTILRHLLRERGVSPRWQIPLIRTPARAEWEWDNRRWPLSPKEPHIGGKVAFLTDGRAVSAAETVMGIVEAYRLGEIVGATTAGTNGNINPFEVAGGFTVCWTGMRVLKHDGSRHHGVGIAPTVPVEPTAAGIAAGRDEVLLRAIELLQKQIGG